MRQATLAVLLLAISGCGREFEMRKEPDLQLINAKELARIHDIRVDAEYAALVSDRTDWQIHTSLAHRESLVDGDAGTAAESSREHRKGDWILIDLGSECFFQNVRQTHGGAGEPPNYRVDVAGKRGFPYTLQFVGGGEPAESVATLPRPVHARFIRITLLEESPTPWRVAELEID